MRDGCLPGDATGLKAMALRERDAPSDVVNDIQDSVFSGESHPVHSELSVSGISGRVDPSTHSLAKSATRSPRPCRPQGPDVKRSCRDVICCIIFLLFLLGYFVVAALAYSFGDINVFLFPADSNGNLCGFGDNADRSQLFYFDLGQCAQYGMGVFVLGCPTPQVCVKECPSENFYAFNNFLSLAQIKEKLICRDGVNTYTKSVSALVSQHLCAPYYLKSRSILNRCVPDIVGNAQDVGKQLQIDGHFVTDSLGKDVTTESVISAIKMFKQFLATREFSEEVVADIVKSYKEVLLGLIGTVAVCLLWIIAMRWMTVPIVVLCVFLFIGGFFSGAVISFYMYSQEKRTGATLESTLFLLAGLVCGGVFIATLIACCFIYSKVIFALQILKESSNATNFVYRRRESTQKELMETVPYALIGLSKFKSVGNMASVCIWPFIIASVQMLVVILGVTVALSLAAVSMSQETALKNITFANGTFDNDFISEKIHNFFEKIPCEDIKENNDFNLFVKDACGVLKYRDRKDFRTHVPALQAANFFMFYWLVNFVTAFGQLTLAGTFASYYWAFDKLLDSKLFPLFNSFRRTVRYHLGSLALGSFIRGVMGITRVICKRLKKVLLKNEPKRNSMRFVLICFHCLLWFVNHMVNFFNENTYIVIAVYGGNFCFSACKVFEFVSQNILRIAVVDKVTDIFFVVSKVVLVGLAATGAYFFFNCKIPILNPYVPEVNNVFVPIFLVTLGSYVVTAAVLSVYKVASDTLLFCVLADLNINDGSPEKPYFMSEGLMATLGIRNLKTKEGKTRKRKCCLCL